MKLISKHGKEVEIKSTQFYIDTRDMFIRGDLSTAYLNDFVIVIYLKNANPLLENQNRIELQIAKSTIELKGSSLVWLGDNGEVTVNMDETLAKVLYYSTFDPENEFLKNLPDYENSNTNI